VVNEGDKNTYNTVLSEMEAHNLHPDSSGCAVLLIRLSERTEMKEEKTLLAAKAASWGILNPPTPHFTSFFHPTPPYLRDFFEKCQQVTKQVDVSERKMHASALSLERDFIDKICCEAILKKKGILSSHIPPTHNFTGYSCTMHG
jgi:hypothetical protein